MKTVVIGYGSIGRRHCRILRGMGLETAVVSRQAVADYPVFSDLRSALAAVDPGYVVIANRTHEHAPALAELRRLGFRGPVLVEKPLCEALSAPEQCGLDSAALADVFVGYNLRFHPLIRRLKELAAHQNVLAVHVYAGQYLPSWRERSYRLCYSGKRAEGGGVLRDLSHELDYVQWLFGEWEAVAAIGGKFSSLAIDSEDVCSLLLRTRHCPAVSIQLNYIDRLKQRRIIVHTDRHTYAADLVANRLQTDECTEDCAADADRTYREQHAAILEGRQAELLCDAAQGLRTVRFIERAEAAASGRCWTANEAVVHDLRQSGLERNCQ